MIDLFIARDIETIRNQQEQLRREEEEDKNAIEGGKVEENKPAQTAGDEDWWESDCLQVIFKLFKFINQLIKVYRYELWSRSKLI